MTPKILLVDDDPSLLRAVQRNLECRYQTRAVTSAHQAVQALEDEGPFAVMVTDVKMPGLDGIQLIQRVRERWPDVISMVLTGNQEEETRLRVGQVRAFRLLHKPTPHLQLSQAIADALDCHQQTVR